MAEKSVSVWTPLLYVATLVLGLVVFSRMYRAQKLRKLAETPQFYQHNFAHEIFEQLKPREKVPPKLLKAALLAWAAEDITRILRFRESEPVLSSLLEQGVIGEDTFERFAGSKTLTERELPEIAGEAMQLQPQWTSVLQSATEIAQQHAVRRRVAQLDTFRQEYHELAGKADEGGKGKTGSTVRLPSANGKKIKAT